MSIITITKKELSKMTDLNNGNVYLKGNTIYKCDKESEQIIKKIHKLSNHPYLKQLAKPIDFLELEQEYIGYTMEYYKNIQNINVAIKKGIVKNLGDYFNELFMIIIKLNILKLIYWDFHEGNILADEKGQPFIIDLDDISEEDSHENLIEQKEYLTEFLLGTFLGEYKGFPAYFRTDAFKQILNKEANEYLDSIYNHDILLTDMPYTVLTELEDQEKTTALKLALK